MSKISRDERGNSTLGLVLLGIGGSAFFDGQMSGLYGSLYPERRGQIISGLYMVGSENLSGMHLMKPIPGPSENSFNEIRKVETEWPRVGPRKHVVDLGVAIEGQPFPPREAPSPVIISNKRAKVIEE